MRGCGAWNPNAMRARSRILVLVDSMSPWERPWSRLASMACSASGDIFGEVGHSASTNPQRDDSIRQIRRSVE